ANRASITGTVRDTSGAVVPGVEVTATNTGTNEPTQTVSNQDGIYVVPNLVPGQYSVEFKRDGFEILLRPSVTLESTQVARIDAALKVGASSQSVTVTADAPVLDQENGSIGTNMNGSVVTDLPLSIYSGGRFVEEFAVAITPGYSPISSPYGAVVNGGQWFTKDYTLDGTSATANIPGDSLETGPTMEAVQEVQAQTSGLDAQSSITGGGVMSFSLKSGTNKFHGSTFLYGHNELLDANSWTNDNLGLEKSEARAWDWGGSLGGPIFRNKTFFFGAFERYTQNDFRLGGPGASVPTPAFLGGDFSAFLGSTLCTQTGGVGPCSGGGTPINVQNDAGQTIPLQYGMIFDPVTGNQFTGNMIPTTMFSGVAQKIIPIYQQHYVPEIGGINGNLRGLIDNSPSQTPNQIVVKLDHNLRTTDRLSGSWVYNHRPRTLDDSGGVWAAGSTDGGPLSEARLQLVRSQEWRVTENHTFSQHVMNVVNLTYNWYWNGSLPTTPSNWNSTLGFAGTGANNFPSISFSDAIAYTETGIGNTWQGNSAGATFIVGDGVTWTKGKHNITFGGDFHAQQVNSHSGSGALSFDFTNNATGAPSQSYGNQVGFAFASFLLGDVGTASQTTPFNLYGREKEMALYAQDSYKVRPNLTLNFGLRWNYNFQFHEKNGSWANYDLQAIDPTLGIPGTLVYAKNGSDSFEKDEYAANFGPQIGLAYSPWKKVVFRGSFGIVYFPPGVPYFD
ncbi:MAG: carboxypeptidase regulatory-like domain-containing protein, partial [Candidatus Sulfotelmatobacter sp.]